MAALTFWAGDHKHEGNSYIATISQACYRVLLAVRIIGDQVKTDDNDDSFQLVTLVCLSFLAIPKFMRLRTVDTSNDFHQ